MQPQFIHLRVHSSYSLLYSTIKNKELAKLCVKNKMPAVAVTDINNVFGAYEFCDAMKGDGVQPIIGSTLAFGYKEHSGPLVLLVQNKAGYKNLIKLISKHHLQGAVTIDDLAGHTQGLIILTGGANGLIGAVLRQSTAQKATAALQEIQKFAGDRLYMEISRHNRPEDDETEDFFIKSAYDMGIPLVATNEALFADEDMLEAHDAMVCISDKTYVLEENRRRFNGSYAFLSQEQMCEKFADMPEAIANTVNIAKRCAHILGKVDTKFPKYSDDPQFCEDETLDRLSREGLDKRLEKIPAGKHQEYKDRLELELSLIKQLEFPGYFLIVYDFINWTKENNIPVGPGRGSGGGSVVAWALRITNIDPIEYHLLFERFINPERVSLPDFDIDFCQTRRGEVIDYVQKRYGADHVAQIITFGKLQARAAIRDVGRVLQIPYPVVDKLCKLVPADPNKKVELQKVMAEEPEFARIASQDERIAKLLDIAVKLEGLYRNCSTHAAGVVIAPQPLDEMVALYRDPDSDFPVTQFDLRFVENIGLIKYDFLGLKTLTVIDNCVKFVKRFHGVDIDIDALPLDDKKTYDLVSRADTAGVFQLESSGMRNVLTGIKPNCIDDIIAIVALFRPGPMHLIQSYITRKHGKEKVDYPHPLMEKYLKDTYGYMIYQEQVMQAAQVLAGYSLGRADILRRAMGKKKPEEMASEESGFIEGCEKTCGIPKAEAKAIFDNIEKFAGYGFNKSHAAAYAIISYQTAFLKANYPLEFFSASMNIDINHTEKLAFYQQELQKSGFKILPPDINISGVEFQPEGGSIRYGLGAVRNTGYGAIEPIISLRKEAGPFKSIE
ncbi:MAG: DNA polymerase III subunit alpha, partial [Alphaproteobacteria bacterium]|nr:DNA polymerase III subunit alpha [Alphaproteobacteria bacterium]